jgi:hypothetical protein
MLKEVKYHGHDITIVYDKDGSKYNIGKGLSVFVNGKNAVISNNKVFIGHPLLNHVEPKTENFALNIKRQGFPKPTASVNTLPDTSLYQAIDGRIWFFPEIVNYWSTRGSENVNDWYALDFDQSKDISGVKLYFFVDGTFSVPDSVRIEIKNNSRWVSVNNQQQLPSSIIGNTVNAFSFNKISAAAIRINFKHPSKQIAISEVECY